MTSEQRAAILNRLPEHRRLQRELMKGPGRFGYRYPFVVTNLRRHRTQ